MPNLETAASPQKLRRIAIDPVTRVEGHGKVTILLDEENKVHQVRLHIVEVRGFERFIEGRPYWEVPVTSSAFAAFVPSAIIWPRRRRWILSPATGPCRPRRRSCAG